MSIWLAIIIAIALVGLCFAARKPIKHEGHDPHTPSPTLSPHSPIYTYMEHSHEAHQKQHRC